MTRAGVGKIEGCASAEVLQEILHVYAVRGQLSVGYDVYDGIVKSCQHVFDVRVADVNLAREILRDIRGISARDAVHAAVMLKQKIAVDRQLRPALRPDPRHQAP
jgi:predicted nucleic acid-binding protein